LALVDAESGRYSHAERWAFRHNPSGQTVNLTADAQAAIAAEDGPAVQRVINRIVANNSADVSFGATQQTYRWSQEWAAWGEGWTAAAVLRFRALYFDPHHALGVAAHLMKALLARTDVNGDVLSALFRYNKPTGLPLPEAQAHYRRALVWADEYLTRQETPTMYTPHIDHDRGTVAGQYSIAPRGVILHGSRSGLDGRTVQAEYDATRRYAASGIELGWNITVGDDALSLHMSPREWGWNARAASRHYLACEFAQPTVHDAITDGQVRAFCWWLRTAVLPVWPTLDATVLPTHAEVEVWGETGARDGKTDVHPFGSDAAEELRQRIATELARQGGTGDELSEQERADLEWYRTVYELTKGEWGQAAEDAIVAAKAERLKGPRNEHLDAALAAVATIRRGGPGEA
jgi:hypothetical protein